jgi:hypothetical protein
MKLLLPAAAILVFTGCTQTISTHRRDFSPPERKGEWTNYYRTIQKGEQPEPPKEKTK